MPDAAKIIKDWCASCGMPEPSDGECHALAVAISAAAPVVLPEQDATLLNQGVELLHALSNDERNRGNCSSAEGATASAYAVQRLAAMLATGGQAQAVETDLHGAVMNLQASKDAIEPFDINRRLAYKMGHRDARHAAAELIALHAPQAQAVGRGEVLVTVSGFTGSGKSAIAGEIEILCRALGLQVEWPDGESEKNMTHADWTAALEQYKPRVRIVEQNIPFVSKKGLSK